MAPTRGPGERQAHIAILAATGALPNAIRKLPETAPTNVAPTGAALPPAPPPIVMNGEGSEVRLGEHRIPTYPFRGAAVVIAGDLDAPFGYQPKGIANLIQGEWRGELREGEDFMVLRGADLRSFKASAALGGGTPPSANARALTVLTEAGVDRVTLLTKKKAGVEARAFTADDVFPKLRRGEAVGPVAPLPPPASDARIDRLQAERVMAGAGVPGLELGYFDAWASFSRSASVTPS